MTRAPSDSLRKLPYLIISKYGSATAYSSRRPTPISRCPLNIISNLPYPLPFHTSSHICLVFFLPEKPFLSHFQTCNNVFPISRDRILWIVASHRPRRRRPRHPGGGRGPSGLAQDPVSILSISFSEYECPFISKGAPPYQPNVCLVIVQSIPPMPSGWSVSDNLHRDQMRAIPAPAGNLKSFRPQPDWDNVCFCSYGEPICEPGQTCRKETMAACFHAMKEVGSGRARSASRLGI